MQQFNLDTWLQDKSRKVVTRDGREVEIFYSNVNKTLLIGRISDTEIHQYTKDGFQYDTINQAKNDLFFADEEEELTELQKTLEEDCDCYVKLYNDGNIREELREWIKCWCNSIIYLARKELELELDKKLKEAYNQGGLDTQEEITKCLPKWKKATKQKDLEKHIAILEENKVLLSNYLEEGDYYIDLEDLKTLPKEE